MKKTLTKKTTKTHYIQLLTQKTGEQRLSSALKLTEFIHWLHQEGKKALEHDISGSTSFNN